MGALVVVTACGTGVGKTHVAEALVRALASRGPAGSFKPVETGVPPSEPAGEDARRLAAVGTFHVKQHQRFVPPISPHLAAERAGSAVDLDGIVAAARAGREQGSLVVELAGGLYSPLSLTLTNADLANALQPTFRLLLATNRLGVLHDVGAVMRTGFAVDAVLLTPLLHAPAEPDESLASNATELARLGVPCWGVLPRAPTSELAEHPLVQRLVSSILA